MTQPDTNMLRQNRPNSKLLILLENHKLKYAQYKKRRRKEETLRRFVTMLNDAI